MSAATPNTGSTRLGATRRAIATFDNVVFRWRGKDTRPVLDHLTFELREGELLGLLGPNGSGKSTSLSLLSGLHLPESGQVRWHLETGSHSPTSPTARSAFSVVFQSPSLDGQLTARDNLSLAAQMRGLDRATARQLTDELLTAFELTARADDRVKTFSGGMKRRLDLARALLVRPQALLLDEPTAGLDEHAFRAFWRALESRRQAGPLAIATATHRPDEAALCDRLLLVHRGKIVAEGRPTDLIASLGEDLIEIGTDHPEEVAAEVARVLQLTTRCDGPERQVSCEVPRGEDAARLLVRIVELFPRGHLERISLKRPTLADVFAKITGERLDAELTEAA